MPIIYVYWGVNAFFYIQKTANNMGLQDQKRIADQFIETQKKTEELDLPRPSMTKFSDAFIEGDKMGTISGDTIAKAKTELEEESLSKKEKQVLSKIEKLLHEEKMTERFGIAILSQEVANRAWIKIGDNPPIPTKVIARETSTFSLEEKVDTAFKDELKEKLMAGNTAEVVQKLLELTKDNPALNDQTTLLAANLNALEQHELTPAEKVEQVKAAQSGLMQVISKI